MKNLMQKALVLVAMVMALLPIFASASDGPAVHTIVVKISVQEGLKFFHEGARVYSSRPVLVRAGDKIILKFQFIDDIDSVHRFSIAKTDRQGVVTEIHQTPLIDKTFNNLYAYEFIVGDKDKDFALYCDIICLGMNKMEIDKIFAKVVRVCD